MEAVLGFVLDALEAAAGDGAGDVREGALDGRQEQAVPPVRTDAEVRVEICARVEELAKASRR